MAQGVIFGKVFFRPCRLSCALTDLPVHLSKHRQQTVPYLFPAFTMMRLTMVIRAKCYYVPLVVYALL